MKKFVVVQKSKAERVVCCHDSSVIVLKPTDKIIEVDIARKVIKGETFLVEKKIEKLKSKYLLYVVAAVALAGAAGFYFWG